MHYNNNNNTLRNNAHVSDMTESNEETPLKSWISRELSLSPSRTFLDTLDKNFNSEVWHSQGLHVQIHNSTNQLGNLFKCFVCLTMTITS